MTPQLQQAIRLLQLSTIELQTEIQQALESNPLLESQEEHADETVETADSSEDKYNDSADNEAAGSADTQNQANNQANESGNNARDQDINLEGQENIPDELPVDSAWEDVYDNIPSYTAAARDPDAKEYEVQDGNGETLRESLMWQLGMLRLSETDATIARTVIDSIDDNGYFIGDIEGIHNSINLDSELEFEEIEAVLRLVQSFEPSGVGARDPQESILIQLRQYDPDTPWLEEAVMLAENHMNLLVNHDHNQLLRRMKISKDELQEVVKLIRSMNPRPGSQMASARTEYIIPDVYVKKIKGVWRVELNPDASPRLRINPYYASLIRRADSSKDNTYLKNQLQEARWFLKSLHSRSETLLKVATSIVKHQQGFLERGEEAMKALVLHDVAEEVSMHESTISRVTTRKYMHTPQGIYELKYFFSSHVSTASGGEASSTAIRALIKKLVESENIAKPLSDSKLASLLGNQGINVARRTVAKYREAMRIPPSNERKRLI